MGAPLIIAKTAASNPKATVRVIAFIVLLLTSLFLVVMGPIIAIPVAVVAGGVDLRVPADPGGPGAPPAVVGDWGMPLAGDYTKGRGFGWNPVAGCSFCSKNHQGYDMAQGCGSQIYAAGPGKVITAGSYSGYGNSVRIDHGGVVTLYGHMAWGSLQAQLGQIVEAGTPLGLEGNTGKSFGCHLHFEVIANGHSIDPAVFMADRGLQLK